MIVKGSNHLVPVDFVHCSNKNVKDPNKRAANKLIDFIETKEFKWGV
jgi:hypothetical protein